MAVIKSVAQNSGKDRDGNLLIELSNLTCTPTGGTPGPFILQGDDPQYATLLSLALAAYLAGKKLTMGYTPSSCVIYNISLQ